ncbi:unnamed protein product [Brachionus calyciflorus]|uniref:R3H domain-containing protein n=1 Tax=Brachionus calyciflorus TaxID=104777 RepID=A0A813M3Z6_9BILA|nr:unnamed protein product [Brachionus calyciflorus]
MSDDKESTALQIINGPIENLIDFLKEKNILRKKPIICPKCNRLTYWSKRSSVSDKHSWRCCTIQYSIRTNSFCGLFDIPLFKLISIIYFWALQLCQIDIKLSIGVSIPVINRCFKFLRAVCVKSEVCASEVDEVVEVVENVEVCASGVDEVVEVVENVEVCASEVDEVVEVVENVEIIELTCLYLSDVESEIFDYAINSIVESIKNKIYPSYSFRSCLTNDQRKKIHELSTEDISETDSLSQALSNIRLESYPRDEHVAEVINKIPIKRGKGRPRKN